MVKHTDPFLPSRDRIIIQREMLPGLLTVLHIRLNHPTIYQLKKVCHRYVFALDLDKVIDEVTSSCHICASLTKLRQTPTPQQTSVPPSTIGSSFAANVIKRHKQLIFILKETVTSFTLASIIDNKSHVSSRCFHLTHRWTMTIRWTTFYSESRSSTRISNTRQ